ncbi:hypothetical protein V475_09340 [Sphingobium baderi LL03]|nr:hypothetical protein V475_09340 [Sphingobium baderi LL03]
MSDFNLINNPVKKVSVCFPAAKMRQGVLFKVYTLKNSIFFSFVSPIKAFQQPRPLDERKE